MYFTLWEKRWYESGGKDINNPKIPVKFVVSKGELFYKQEEELPSLLKPAETVPPVIVEEDSADN